MTAIGCLPITKARVRLISRRGLDWGDRFPTIVAAVEALAVHTCTIDGELIACDANGDPVISFPVRSDRISTAAICGVKGTLPVRQAGHPKPRKGVNVPKDNMPACTAGHDGADVKLH
jgi:hypothetical protein